VEKLRVCRPMSQICINSDEDPDPHLSDKSDPDPHLSEKRLIRIRIQNQEEKQRFSSLFVSVFSLTDKYLLPKAAIHRYAIYIITCLYPFIQYNILLFASTIFCNQCCGSGSGIGCLFDPWIRDPGWEKVSIRIRNPG
jgi:hypothetical protein